jgi:hypothetical protein
MPTAAWSPPSVAPGENNAGRRDGRGGHGRRGADAASPRRRSRRRGGRDRAIVLAVLDGRLEVADAVREGSIFARGDVESVGRIFHAIEIILDISTRSPELRAIARQSGPRPRAPPGPGCAQPAGPPRRTCSGGWGCWRTRDGRDGQASRWITCAVWAGGTTRRPGKPGRCIDGDEQWWRDHVLAGDRYRADRPSPTWGATIDRAALLETTSHRLPAHSRIEGVDPRAYSCTGWHVHSWSWGRAFPRT